MAVQLRKALFDGVFDCMNQMVRIVPIFPNLNELEIYLRKWSRLREKVDLIGLCPNLTVLESDILPFEWRSKPFLSLISFIYWYAEIHIDREFLKYNSQLKRIRLYGKKKSKMEQLKRFKNTRQISKIYLLKFMEISDAFNHCHV